MYKSIIIIEIDVRESLINAGCFTPAHKTQQSLLNRNITKRRHVHEKQL